MADFDAQRKVEGLRALAQSLSNAMLCLLIDTQALQRFEKLGVK